MSHNGFNPAPGLTQNLLLRIQAHAMNMIWLANNRDDVEKGDPKVGGHPSACSSALQMLSTLHLIVKNPQDAIACKPHASPVDHANNYLLRNFAEPNGERMNDERARLAMKNLRHFSHKGEPVFQSYHSVFDPDGWNYFPSGSVGIPPVQALYMAHAYRMAESHGHKIPKDAHFWCLMGDSEFREGSLSEAMPEAAERGLGNLTWILDYNRQSLDGHRVLNEAGLGKKDNDRVDGMMTANGWDVIQLRHGSFRKEVFAKSGAHGEALQNVLENALPDYEFQALLSGKNGKTIAESLSRYDQGVKKAFSSLSEEQIVKFLFDLGGHDVVQIVEALEESKKDPEKPVFIVSHTVKGWNLDCAAQSANHSAMIEDEEVYRLRERSGLKARDLLAFERFDENSPEGKYLKERGEYLWTGIQSCKKIKSDNIEKLRKELQATGADKAFPTEVGINLKFVPSIHTQWMLGQISAKLTRIAETPLDEKLLTDGQKPLNPEERKLKAAANGFIMMAPDVGTSTNLNAGMDGRIFGPETEDFEGEYGVKDSKAPDIVPHESPHSRFIRFDIAEGNTMSCVASYGKMGDWTGVPFVPLMTVYDFFIKRALDQFFYGAYWTSSFILVGTPSGITLSPEGAQHGWKTDLQIANGISWEPAYCQELDWIMTESIRRHVASYVEGPDSPNSNTGRSAVVIRAVTRSLEQKEFLKRLKAQARFSGQDDATVLEATRKDCLEGAYYLVDHRGQPGYRPSENVVQIFTMGSLVTEALKASDELLAQGVFANVIQVSSTDLLLGNLAEKNGYRHLRQGLGVTGDLYLQLNQKAYVNGSGRSESYPAASVVGPKPFDALSGNAQGALQLMTLGGRRIPIVSVHDGEPGLMDNIGSVVGTLQKTLATRKHSKSGRPSDIFAYHGLDAASVAKACLQVLEESAITGVGIDPQLAQSAGLAQPRA
jgi:pyruvate dehydrogenase E1 component